MSVWQLRKICKFGEAGLCTALLALVGAWALFLFFQFGHAWDEAEHAHVAWLVSRGGRPLDDFFQHHQPLLWSVLALYFRVGLTGPGVLIWGRVLVVLAAIAVAASHLLMGCAFDAGRRSWAGWLGVVWFIGMTVALPELFVIRPETISAACILVALALWCQGPSGMAVFMAGVSAGVACYASPRFVLVGGCFCLLGAQSKRRWLIFLLGVAAFIVLYTELSGFSFAKILFNLRFSAYLQTVGDGMHGLSTNYLALVAELALLPLAALIGTAIETQRWRAIALVGYACLVTVVCLRSAGIFRYAQAFAPAVTTTSIAALWIGARMTAYHRVAVFGTVSIALAVVLGWTILNPGLPAFNFLSTVEAREQLAASIPDGAKVLVFTLHSPITIDDSSYYGSPIWDSQDRLCRAVRGFKSKYSLPECDFFEALKNGKPYLTEIGIERSVGLADAPKLDAIVKAKYAVPKIARKWPLFFGGLVARIDTAESR